MFQATPYSKSQKKVVELPGGEQAQTSGAISNIGGWNILDNNQVHKVISRLIEGQFYDDFYDKFHLDGIVCILMSKILSAYIVQQRLYDSYAL